MIPEYKKITRQMAKRMAIRATMIHAVILSLTLQGPGSALVSAESKYQIDIEDEIESGVVDKASGEEEQSIVVEGEDEKLIRTLKEDTTFVSPTDESGVRWFDDQESLEKEGKSKRRAVEKSGEIQAGYGLYNHYDLKLNFVKSDKFGLYRVGYARVNWPAENFDNAEIPNSDRSIDNVKITFGSRLTPQYTLMVDTSFQGTTGGLQENPVYDSLTRRWGFLGIDNQIKPGKNQLLKIRASADYLESVYNGGAADSTDAYLNPAVDADWTYMFDSRIALSVKGHYDFLYVNGDESGERSASTVSSHAFFYWPLLKTYGGNSGGIPWQMNLTLGAGVNYREGGGPLTEGEASLENRFGFWYSRLGLKKAAEFVDLRNPVYFSFYATQDLFTVPRDYWDVFWENGFIFSKENIVKVRGGYKAYDIFLNPVLNADELYTFEQSAYDEVYARVSWEYFFLKNFLLESGLRLNYGLAPANLIPLYEFQLSIGYDSERFDATIGLRGVGSRTIGAETMADYFLLDAALKFWINPSFSLILRGENLLNQNYMDYFPYNNSGLKLFFGCYIKI